MREEVMELKKDLKEIKEESFARELLKDMRKANKRQFIIIVILIACWFITGGYLIYILNDIGYIDEDNDTIEIQDVEQIDNSTIKIGDDIWEKSE